MIIEELKTSGLDYQIIGDQEYCVDSTLNVALIGISSEALMLATKSYCGVSNGSACTSKSYSPSYVLRAMSIPDELINYSIRISWGNQTDLNESKDNMQLLIKVARQLVG